MVLVLVVLLLPTVSAGPARIDSVGMPSVTRTGDASCSAYTDVHYDERAGLLITFGTCYIGNYQFLPSECALAPNQTLQCHHTASGVAVAYLELYNFYPGVITNTPSVYLRFAWPEYSGAGWMWARVDS